ncbi:SAG family member [Eimeria mitis]|uniref:SAG family member n=1 Tax=Eimeria mitis TaxID=44415 RepID=U6JT49_9EIME|nr:SAG family member [Eimeria mitis]CDJ27941.1 SAG family member [Eimeria mitis]
MAALKLFSLASASALVMANAVQQTEKQTPLTTREVTSTYTVNLGETAVCLDEINDAREAAGLARFVTGNTEDLAWPKTGSEGTKQQTNAWDPVCKALIEDDSQEPEESPASSEFKSGTYAFMALESETPDCAAAVSHWKDAASNFTTIPPAKTEETDLYDKQQNVSFIAMYNPSNGAAADCRVVTCTLPPNSGPVAFNIRKAAEEKKGYALLCMTTPDALKDEKVPFTDDQWNKIKASITGSASAVAPSLLAVAIAALGLVAL